MVNLNMFGNLLDNALEAAEGGNDGYIFAGLYKENEALIILKKRIILIASYINRRELSHPLGPP